jgi:Leucine-rich repeat (LRR) protein
MGLNWKLAGRNLYYTLLGLIGLTATWKFIIYQPDIVTAPAVANLKEEKAAQEDDVYYYAASEAALHPDAKGMVLLNTALKDSSALVHIDSVRILNVEPDFDHDNFPEAVFKFKNLRLLWVGMRGFKTIPPGISQLKYLEEIDCQHGAIETLPDEFCQLKNLRTAIFLFSNLKELPECIGELENLDYLHLGQTHITRFPKSMRSLKKLRMVMIQQSPDGPHISKATYRKLKHWLPNCGVGYELRKVD